MATPTVLLVSSTILLVFISKFVSLRAAIATNKFRKIHDHVLDRSVSLETHVVRDLWECAQLCSRTEFCPAAVFTKDHGRLCEFFPVYVSENFVTSPGNTVLLKQEENICEVASPCANGGSCLFYGSGNYTCECTAACCGVHCTTCEVIDCLYGEVTTLSVTSGGVTEDMDVFLEAGPHGDGWIVLMRRKDGSVDFVNRNWNDYKAGFGNLEGEFYLGNENIHRLTTNGSTWTLRLDLRLFSGESSYAEYSVFSVASEGDKYRLSVGGYSPVTAAGDSLTGPDYGDHDGARFSTWDQDNDASGVTDCAGLWKGGWWYTSCFLSKLTGYWHETYPGGEKVEWESWQGEDVSMQWADMKIRIQ